MFGRYELVRTLGRGGSGTVYEAVRHGPGPLRRRVALKILEGPGAPREGRLGGLLRHRNLVDVTEVGEVDGRGFVAMELCPGGALAARAPLPPRAVVEVGVAVCEALTAAREQLGLLHLDLKPDNLLVGAGGVLKVADLGSALADGVPAVGRSGGTRGFVAPERRAGGPVDARADVFGLGATLAALAGAAPEAATWVATGVDGDGPAPTGPEWLAPALARALADDPADRWADLRAFGEALRALPDPGGPGLAEVLGDVPPEPDPPPPPLRGREAELSTLLGHLAEPGAVVVHGPPGVGRSRLVAAALARRSLPTLVLRSPARLRPALDAALRLERGASAAAELRARGAVVLWIDDADGLAGDPDLAALRREAPELRVVSTAVSPAGLPADAALALAGLPEEDGLAVLRDRARDRGVDLPDTEAARDLVRRLDGLPLALELAAGRLGALTLEELLQRLDARFLRDGRGALADVFTAALDALDAGTRAALAALVVFVAPFTPEDAAAVADRAPGDAGPLLDALAERGLLVADGPERLRVPAALRAFLLPAPPAVRDRHLAWATRFAETWLDRERGPDPGAAIEAIGRVLPDLLAAADHAARAGAAGQGTLVLRAVLPVADAVAPEVVLQVATRLLDGGATGGDRLRLLGIHVSTGALGGLGDVGLAERTVAEARAHGDPELLGRALANLAMVARGPAAFQAALDEALTYLPDPWSRAGLLVNGAAATLRGVFGTPLEARERLEEALALVAPGSTLAAVAMANRALVGADLLELGRAEADGREALRRHAALGRRLSVARVRHGLSRTLQLAGRIEEAVAEASRAREAYLRAGVGALILDADAAWLALLAGRPAEARARLRADAPHARATAAMLGAPVDARALAALAAEDPSASVRLYARIGRALVGDEPWGPVEASARSPLQQAFVAAGRGRGCRIRGDEAGAREVLGRATARWPALAGFFAQVAEEDLGWHAEPPA